jgi:hypothetical protein
MKNLNAEEQLGALLDSYEEQLLATSDDEIIRDVADRAGISDLRQLTERLLNSAQLTTSAKAPLPRRSSHARKKLAARGTEKETARPVFRRSDGVESIHAFMDESDALQTDPEEVLERLRLAREPDGE